jgi:cytochrome oxidase assembly protein ShyY1
VLVLALVVAMVNLGFWQLRRLDAKRTTNRLVASRQEVAEAPIDEVLDPTESAADASGALYRRVEVTGTYDEARSVVVRARSYDGVPGVWVLTPLRTADGVAAVVNRGWLPTQGTPRVLPAAAAPPEGEVTVEGLLLASQERGRFGPSDPAEGTLSSIARVDLGRLQRQLPYDVYPAWVQLVDQQPAQAGELPRPLQDPAPGEGPHLGYAVQWFVFSAIALGGYPLILRRNAAERARERRG